MFISIIIFVAYAAAVLLCITGALLSMLTVSGTWLVLIATILLALLPGTGFPGIITVMIFIAFCLGAELFDVLSSVWGIKKKGGSNLAGLAAAVGAITGLCLGILIPVPVIGNLIGMVGGSFLLAFLVEYRRFESTDKAADIAFGAVLARLGAMLFKICITFGMIGYLVIGIMIR